MKRKSNGMNVWHANYASNVNLNTVPLLARSAQLNAKIVTFIVALLCVFNVNLRLANDTATMMIDIVPAKYTSECRVESGREKKQKAMRQ